MFNASVSLSLVFSAIVATAVPLPLPTTTLVKPIVTVADVAIPNSSRLVETLVGITKDMLHTVGHLEGSLGHTAGQLDGPLGHAAGGSVDEADHLAGELLGVLGASHTHGQDDAGGLLDLWPDFWESLGSLTSGDKGDSSN